MKNTDEIDELELGCYNVVLADLIKNLQEKMDLGYTHFDVWDETGPYEDIEGHTLRFKTNPFIHTLITH